ncbi:hypothetical protein TRIP_E380060 [uncultured Spirochaetota bacterium]|uniref:Uncharacterized protein n=1 Tax=uncultured Spirochaetota bacterium TaxID=460511 RepID=A0A652ZYS6_9SPIR|nr:hypothetical protein TRIP_E380060 [uncultured Spirochaetota bacterium]
MDRERESSFPACMKVTGPSDSAEYAKSNIEKAVRPDGLFMHYAISNFRGFDRIDPVLELPVVDRKAQMLARLVPEEFLAQGR